MKEKKVGFRYLWCKWSHEPIRQVKTTKSVLFRFSF